MTIKDSLKNWDSYADTGAGLGRYERVWAVGQDRAFFGDNAEHRYAWSYKKCQATGIYRKISPLAKLSDSTESGHCQYQCTGYPENEATAGVWDQLTQSNFNAGVFAGEFRETVDFISSTVRRVAGSVAAARKGNFSLAFAILGQRKGSIPSTLSDQWLQYKYALMPLLTDIQAAYKLLTRQYKTILRCKSPASKGPDTPQATAVNGIAWSYDGERVAEARGVVEVEITLADRIGLTDPRSIAWELTRFSFVIDWLLPIGTFLKAANARNKTYFVPGTIFVSRAIGEQWTSPKPYREDVLWNPRAQSDYVFRNVGDRYGVAALPVRLPVITNPLAGSYDRYISAIALLGQALRGR